MARGKNGNGDRAQPAREKRGILERENWLCGLRVHDRSLPNGEWRGEKPFKEISRSPSSRRDEPLIKEGTEAPPVSLAEAREEKHLAVEIENKASKGGPLRSSLFLQDSSSCLLKLYLETGRKIDSFAKRFPVKNGVLDSERVDKAM